MRTTLKQVFAEYGAIAVVLYLVLFVVLFLSPTLFGALSIEVNNADHVLHAVLAVVSLLVGFAARRQSSGTPAMA